MSSPPGTGCICGVGVGIRSGVAVGSAPERSAAHPMQPMSADAMSSDAISLANVFLFIIIYRLFHEQSIQPVSLFDELVERAVVFERKRSVTQKKSIALL